MPLTIGQRTPLESKGWKGVRDVEDPYSVGPDFLARATNIYFPEIGSGAGAYARPGFLLRNSATQLGGSGNIGQGMAVATDATGVQYNFVVVGGKLYRVDQTFTVYTDVTPVSGVAIDTAARVHLTPFSNRLLINDDVNVPWVASDLSSTPVTGTAIQYSNVGVPWRAYGPGRVYQGTPFWVVRYRDSDARMSRIGWGRPDDPLTGYLQPGAPGFTNEWNVVENDPDPIFALWSSNLTLDYFREASIGYASGADVTTLQTTSTSDAINEAVGCRAPATIDSFGPWVYFADTRGRVHRYQYGAETEELWRQHARVVDLAPQGFADANVRTSCAAIVPELNLYLVALWSNDPTQALPQFPTTMYAWDARSGRYCGNWMIDGGVAIHAIGSLVDVNGQRVLAILGTQTAPASPQPLSVGGYLWTLGRLADGIWTDNGNLPTVSVTTPPLGYDADLALSVDETTAIVEELVTDPTAVAVDLVVLP